MVAAWSRADFDLSHCHSSSRANQFERGYDKALAKAQLSRAARSFKGISFSEKAS